MLYMNKNKRYVVLLMIVSALIGIFFYVKSTGVLDFMNSAEKFKEYIMAYEEKAYLMFFIIQFLSVIIAPIPSNVSAVVGGTVFGMWSSFSISMLAIISGSIIVFILGRKFGETFANKFVNSKVLNKYQKYLSSRNGELLLIIILFLPFLPDDIVGFVVGLSKISLKKYVIIMLFTRPWEILAASALGASDMAIPLWEWGIIALFIVFIMRNSDKIEKKLVNAVRGC